MATIGEYAEALAKLPARYSTLPFEALRCVNFSGRFFICHETCEPLVFERGEWRPFLVVNAAEGMASAVPLDG